MTQGRSAYHGCEDGLRPRLDRDVQITNLKTCESTNVPFRRKRVTDKIADGGEHSGNQVAIGGHEIWRGHVGEQQAGVVTDEQYLLDTKDQRVSNHDLRGGHTGTSPLELPLQSAQ